MWANRRKNGWGWGRMNTWQSPNLVSATVNHAPHHICSQCNNVTIVPLRTRQRCDKSVFIVAILAAISSTESEVTSALTIAISHDSGQLQSSRCEVHMLAQLAFII